MIFGDLLSYRTNDLMVKTDRASMAVALEARAPLMDYQLAEYAWRLPADMKVQGGQGKWLLRQILKKHIPENLYERPKMGFSIPLNQWLQGPLKEWANELLAPEKIKNQGLFDVDLIRDTWNNFQICDGAQSSRKDLWTILMFQSWYKEWME
jgi:asparagine synthase (glutamine-hydrolysing)